MSTKGAIGGNQKASGPPTGGKQILTEGEILTVGEVARLKRVTRAAVYAAITQGRLPHVRLLGRLGIKADAARAWRPVRWPGRPKGIPMNPDAKKRISHSQRQRWKERKAARAGH